MSGILSKYPDLKGFSYDYGDATVGAMRAFKAANKPLDIVATIQSDDNPLFCAWKKEANPNFKVWVQSAAVHAGTDRADGRDDEEAGRPDPVGDHLQAVAEAGGRELLPPDLPADGSPSSLSRRPAAADVQVTDVDVTELEVLRRQVQDLVDREAIRDCSLRYARGLDRHDPEIYASPYHPDAIDRHGEFLGRRDDFVPWGLALLASEWDAHTHYITNIRVDIDGDAAHAESYVMFVQRRRDGGNHDVAAAATSTASSGATASGGSSPAS